MLGELSADGAEGGDDAARLRARCAPPAAQRVCSDGRLKTCWPADAYCRLAHDTALYKEAVGALREVKPQIEGLQAALAKSQARDLSEISADSHTIPSRSPCDALAGGPRGGLSPLARTER